MEAAGAAALPLILVLPLSLTAIKGTSSEPEVLMLIMSFGASLGTLELELPDMALLSPGGAATQELAVDEGGPSSSCRTDSSNTVIAANGTNPSMKINGHSQVPGPCGAG